jgi:alkylation response protein AidB-like acyl-CoA dehydrogenase
MSATFDMARIGESREKREWRTEVRRFVETHLPADLARKVATGLKIDKDDYVRWQKILYEHGWFAGAWPIEFGGQGWDLVKQLIFTQEAATCNAPMIMPYGVGMVGPVIYTYGTDDQKREHLPGILSSDVWWCQGYSEPGAGSDLASLKTFAELRGDHYVVNGSKMWTTEAHWADKMHCLVRTSRDGKPQQGISFLLIDMNTPGITVQPIVTIDGIHHTNQTFFDNVRVPVTNRVGEEGRGWAIAKFLLGNERTSIADTGPKLRLLKHLKSMHAAFMADGRNGASLQSNVTLALADLEIQLLTLCNLEAHYVDLWMGGRKIGAEASILKIRGTEILQALSELALQLEGPLAAAHDPLDLHLPPDANLTPAQQASVMGHEYLYGRCWSIFGGTNEIQRNIIAREILSA